MTKRTMMATCSGLSADLKAQSLLTLVTQMVMEHWASYTYRRATCCHCAREHTSTTQLFPYPQQCPGSPADLFPTLKNWAMLSIQTARPARLSTRGSLLTGSLLRGSGQNRPRTGVIKSPATGSGDLALPLCCCLNGKVLSVS